MCLLKCGKQAVEKTQRFANARVLLYMRLLKIGPCFTVYTYTVLFMISLKVVTKAFVFLVILLVYFPGLPKVIEEGGVKGFQNCKVQHCAPLHSHVPHTFFDFSHLSDTVFTKKAIPQLISNRALR